MAYPSRSFFFPILAAILTCLPLMTCQASLLQVFSWANPNPDFFSGTATLEFDAPSGNQDNLIILHGRGDHQ